jgi:hypothetical protein
VEPLDVLRARILPSAERFLALATVFGHPP